MAESISHPKKLFFLLSAASCFLLAAPLNGQEPPPKQVLQVAWRGEAGTLEVYDNSETFSTVLSINASGSVLGIREATGAAKGILLQQHFFANDKMSRDAPLLAGYTNTELQALSDDDKAVGYASRAAGNPNGSLTAIVWDTKSGEVTDLGKLPMDGASHATDISADGKRIVGYSTGAQPARMRPCIWQWNATEKQWDVSALPTIHLQNPYLLNSGILISPDGQLVTACASFEILGPGVFDSSLFAWKLEDGQWLRQDVSEKAGRLKDINNSGRIAMNITTPRGVVPATVDLSGDLDMIDLLAEDVTGQALAVSSNGQVYGFSDDPPGPDGGPTAFVWLDGKTTQPAFTQPAYFSSVTACNAQGQLGGLVDVIIKGGRPRLAGSDKQQSQQEEDAEGLSAKTLGFRWTPSSTTK